MREWWGGALSFTEIRAAYAQKSTEPTVRNHMAIPPISTYTIPEIHEVPESKVSWRLDPRRSALLVHDMQNYFIDAYDVQSEPMSTAMENMVRIRELCSEAGIPVIYTMQPGDQHPSRRGILADFWLYGSSDLHLPFSRGRI